MLDSGIISTIPNLFLSEFNHGFSREVESSCSSWIR